MINTVDCWSWGGGSTVNSERVNGQQWGNQQSTVNSERVNGQQWGNWWSTVNSERVNGQQWGNRWSSQQWEGQCWTVRQSMINTVDCSSCTFAIKGYHLCWLGGGGKWMPSQTFRASDGLATSSHNYFNNLEQDILWMEKVWLHSKFFCLYRFYCVLWKNVQNCVSFSWKTQLSENEIYAFQQALFTMQGHECIFLLILNANFPFHENTWSILFSINLSKLLSSVFTAGKVYL